MDNFDLRSYLSSNPLTVETPVLEGIDFLNRVGIKIQINEAEEDPKTLDFLNIASLFDKEFDEETKDAISALVKTKPDKQDFKSLLDPTLKEEEKDEKKNTAFMNVVRNLQRIGKTNLLPLVMAFTIMGNALPKGIPVNPWDNAQEKIEQTYSPGEIPFDAKTLDADDELAFRGDVQVGGENVLDMNGPERSMGDNIGGFGTGEGTTNPEVQAQVDDYWDNLTKSTVGQEGEADVFITGKYSKDSGADSNKSKTSDLDLDDERGQTVLKLLKQKLSDSGGKINGVKVNLKVLDNNASDIEAQKDGDIGKGVILKTVFDTVKSSGDIPVDTVQDVYAFLNPLFARWRDVRWVKDSVDQVVQQYSSKKASKSTTKTSSDSSPEKEQSSTVEPPKPSTKKVTSSQTAKDVKAVQAGNLNRNGQIATVLRTLNFDNLNVFKELGKDAAVSLSDGDLKKIIDNPESSEQAKTVARGIIQIRKNPDALLKRVSSVLGVKLDPRAKAVQLKPGQKGQAQFRAGVKENILNEGFVDDFITDEDIRNNKVALLALLGSMYASDEVKGEYLSIANPDKLGFTDSERAEFEELGWNRKDDSGDYVFLDKTTTKKKEKPVPDADKAAQTISKIGGAEQKMDFINLKDELVDTIVKTWMKFSPTYRETPANISKVFTVLRNDPFGLKEEEEKELKDVTNVFKVLQTNKSLDAQLSRINTNDEAIRIIRTGIFPYINDVLKKNESQIRQAMKDALEVLTNQLKQKTNERKLTKSELAKREDIIMKMKKNKRALTQKYGKDAEAVMYGRATNLAKKQAEGMDQDKIKELVKDALQNPKKADLNKDGKLSDYEKKRGAAIEKAMANELDATEKAASDKIGRGEEFTDDDASAVADKMPKIGKDKEFKLMGEGFYGSSEIESAVDALGYDNLGHFFEDNPGAVSAMMDWMESVPEFGKVLRDADLMEDLDLGHTDDEPHMLKADLYRIGKYAMELYSMLEPMDHSDEEFDFPHWWQAKIIKAKDALVSAKHYLDFELKEPSIDMAMGIEPEGSVETNIKLDAEEDVIDENARDKAAMMFDKMKVGNTIKTSKGEFKKVDDKHFEMVGKPGRKFTAKQMTFIKEETVNEGVWSLGTADQIQKAIQSLEMLSNMDAASIADSLEEDGKFYYNVIGDDLFHDALDNAERSAAMGDIDRAQNGLADAIGRAEDLLKHVRERESARPYKTDIFNEVASKLAKQLKSK